MSRDLTKQTNWRNEEPWHSMMTIYPVRASRSYKRSLRRSGMTGGLIVITGTNKLQTRPPLSTNNIDQHMKRPYFVLTRTPQKTNTCDWVHRVMACWFFLWKKGIPSGFSHELTSSELSATCDKTIVPKSALMWKTWIWCDIVFNIKGARRIASDRVRWKLRIARYSERNLWT